MMLNQQADAEQLEKLRAASAVVQARLLKLKGERRGRALIMTRAIICMVSHCEDAVDVLTDVVIGIKISELEAGMIKESKP